MSEQKYIVVKPVAFGPEVSDRPRTAAELLGNHESLRRRKEGQTIEERIKELADQSVAAGHWEPQEINATMSSPQPTSPDRLAELETRLAKLEQENSELRQKPQAANRMKPAADNR